MCRCSFLRCVCFILCSFLLLPCLVFASPVGTLPAASPPLASNVPGSDSLPGSAAYALAVSSPPSGGFWLDLRTNLGNLRLYVPGDFADRALSLSVDKSEIINVSNSTIYFGCFDAGFSGYEFRCSRFGPLIYRTDYADWRVLSVSRVDDLHGVQLLSSSNSFSSSSLVVGLLGFLIFLVVILIFRKR